MADERRNLEEPFFNPHPLGSLKRLFYGYVLVHTLLMIMYLSDMTNLQAAVFLWLVLLVSGMFAIPSLASFVICNSMTPPLGGEICVWAVYILLILGAILPGGRTWRRCSVAGLLVLMFLAHLGLSAPGR